MGCDVRDILWCYRASTVEVTSSIISCHTQQGQAYDSLCETILRLHCTTLPWVYVGLCRTIRLYVRLCDARRAYMSLWHYLSIISTLWVLFPDSWHPMHALRTICDAREPPESLKMFLGLLWIFYKMEIYTKSTETISDRCAKLILFKVCRRMLALAFSSKTPIYPIYLSSLSNPSKLSNLSNHVSSVYLVWSVSEVSIAKCLSCAECWELRVGTIRPTDELVEC